ncbi:MAG: hypothetical protein HeimC3_06730 [Candidatus Heimdallarchaeota archaeon LC_3]|nr:MAG: hypothetical protein HeimC3_06730 [Candidatus Heimdallarchaeota archaeon LC_3]
MITLSKKQTNIAEVLVRQFNSSWKMLERAINNVSDELWNKFEIEWGYVRNLIHIIETGEFYNSDTPDDFNWGKFVGIEWKKDSKKEVNKKFEKITKDDVRRYLEVVRSYIQKKLSTFNSEKMLDSDGFMEYIPSIFDKYLYLLRHNMHHIGELNKTLRDNNEKRINWS